MHVHGDLKCSSDITDTTAKLLRQCNTVNELVTGSSVMCLLWGSSRSGELSVTRDTGV
jgi:hypothetical protein